MLDMIVRRESGAAGMGRASRACLWLILSGALLGCSIKLGLWAGTAHWYQLRYFTTLSNLLAAIYSLWALLRGRDRTPPLLHGAALMAVLVTGVIYHLLLRGTFGGFTPFTLGWLGDQMVHTAVPVLMALDWLLFVPKGRSALWYPLGWAVFPAAYFAGTVLIARTGCCLPNSNTPYPYPFLDVWALGWGPVLRNAALVGLAYLGLGWGLVWLDRRLAEQKTDVVKR